MTVYVALLRAIGPISHAIMRPAALRDRAEEAGLGNPVNYLATGNLIFDSDSTVDEARRQITALVEGFGLTSSEVFIKTRRQIAAVLAADPFPDASAERPARLGVCFFHRTVRWPASLLRPAGPELVAAVGPALVIDYGPGVSSSSLQVEKLAGAHMTQRNWNSVRGILQRMDDR